MPIFTHIMVGSNDKEKSKAFYDAVLAPLGIKNMGTFGDARTLIYGVNQPEFWVTSPANGQPATHANGGTIGFIAPSRKAVHEFHAGGIANGGTCEGEPGPRDFAPTAYAAYLRDPDGNKICTYCMKPE
ncbi:VOC family protein [Hyphococcus flavus]|uniref:VOC family protein n=1 Tax=Hyphococcus flavus TaxID=1866326 RepID=A0AAE9ZET6_9PROT|nr:VOC family protein [Hyphococcus flavus]WDI31352.1 VOC family protein [Hyphococcus flavus]